jgi:hypothetical protein
VTIAEAAATRNNGEAARQIGLCHDQNRRDRERAGMLADDVELQLTPLEAAVWAKRRDVVQLLIESGAVAEGDALQVLRCLAEMHQDGEMRAFLQNLSAAPWPDCSTVHLPTRRNQ